MSLRAASLVARISQTLTEPVMGFLALAAFCAALAPLLFAMPAAIDDACAVLGWLVLIVFAVEFSAGLITAPDRARFLRNP